MGRAVKAIEDIITPIQTQNKRHVLALLLRIASDHSKSKRSQGTIDINVPEESVSNKSNLTQFWREECHDIFREPKSRIQNKRFSRDSGRK